MKTTFLVARNLAVSPFEVMSQDLEYVIMVVNFLVESANEHKAQSNSEGLTEKQKDRNFWSAI